MEVKVFCPCGTKYKFDVEPVNQSMPVPVQCPECGQDGTEAANQIIKTQLTAPPPAAKAFRIVVPKPVQPGAPPTGSSSQPIRVAVQPARPASPPSPPAM